MKPVAAEDVRLRLRRKLEEMVGVDEADLLMDRPPGGWGDLVTKDWLHLELSVVDARFDAVDKRLNGIEVRLDKLEERMTALEREFRAQTWKLVGAMAGLFAALAIVIKL
jgi:chromosome condensin MukBEF ATPase and DNA-binding subunit MukB